MLTQRELTALLRAHGLRLTKRLGQHHLIDPRIIERVAASCALSRSDTVVEIGAGLGALTEPLAQRAGQVLAVEVDRAIAALLTQRMASSANVTVLCQDILNFSWEDVTGPLVVVGAIPYHVTSPIIVELTERRRRIHHAVLIVQDEVARRLAATPGTKAYGRLSVLAQYGWDLAVLFRVSRRAFFPSPQVDSACVRFSRRSKPPIGVEQEARFFDVVKAAFAHRRKTLVNSVSRDERLGLTRARAEALVRELGLPVAVRGETLTLQQFARLANLL